jgi:hypothetical protein
VKTEHISPVETDHPFGSTGNSTPTNSCRGEECIRRRPGPRFAGSLIGRAGPESGDRRQLALSRTTIDRLLHCSEPPLDARPPGSSQLDPFGGAALLFALISSRYQRRSLTGIPQLVRTRVPVRWVGGA